MLYTPAEPGCFPSVEQRALEKGELLTGGEESWGILALPSRHQLPELLFLFLS